MRNFYRAVRLAFHYRWTLLGAFVCSLFVAVLWGGNFSVIYPFVEIVAKRQSLGDWVDSEISQAQEKMGHIEAHIAKIQADLPAAQGSDRVRLEREIGYQQSRFDAERRAHDRARWMQT
jgi:hypothetical protein